jgi:phosphoribosyl-ATP pyrophosphohydrolase
MMSTFTLRELERIVANRASASPEESYTARLIAGGTARIAKKFGEEAVEAVLASVVESDEALTGEAADVLYHLLVMLKARGIAVDSVMSELERRTTQTGLEEKASRKQL